MSQLPPRTTVGFVGAVLAVAVSVTPPLPVYALSAAALHLAGRALGWGCRVTAATGRRLVGLVLREGGEGQRRQRQSPTGVLGFRV